MFFYGVTKSLHYETGWKRYTFYLSVIRVLPGKMILKKEGKEQTMNKLLSILLTLTMLLSLIVPVFAETAEEDEYPVRFDLRDYGVVTPVKRQNPWGSCWSFGGIAAAESSILTTLGLTNAQYKEMTGKDFDLSEKHLLWFATHPITELTDPKQAGEGLYNNMEGDNPNAIYNSGGGTVFVTTLFSSGVGPVPEEYFPYQGSEGLTDIQYANKYYDEMKPYLRSVYSADPNTTVEEAVTLVHEQPDKFEELFGEVSEKGYLNSTAEELTVEQVDEAYLAWYTAVMKRNGETFSARDDWTIPYSDENGRSNRDIYAGFTLVDGNILPSLMIKDKEGKWLAVNDAGVRAVKSELLQGRAVSAGFKADKSRPGEAVSAGYMNTDTWAHYTYEDVPQSHAICIIGWDDNYSKDNFNPDHMPPADGAWLVKNSWGSETDYVTLEDGTEIGKDAWGIENADGKHTGYFYISYYDKTLNNSESMVFDTDLLVDGTEMGVWMYDYMPASFEFETGVEVKEQSTDMLKTANVFVNDTGSDVRLYGVSTKTASPRARVVYSLYLLNDDAQNPEDGKLLDRKVGYYEYAGFHRQKLNGEITIKDGETLAIVAEESIVNANGERLYEYAVNTAPTEKTAEALDSLQYGVSVVNKGESFLYEDSQWKDWSDELAKAEQEYAGEGFSIKEAVAVDNFSIKAYVLKDAE